MNLYSMGENDAINNFDALGLKVDSCRCKELREKYQNYIGPAKLFDSPDEANLNGALRAAELGGLNQEAFQVEEGPMKGRWLYLTRDKPGDGVSRVEYVWGIVSASGGKYYSTWATTENIPTKIAPGSNPWIVKANNEGRLYAYGHFHPDPRTYKGLPSGYYEQKKREGLPVGRQDVGYTDQDAARYWGGRMYVTGSEGTMYSGDLMEYKSTLGGIITQDDLRDLLICLEKKL